MKRKDGNLKPKKKMKTWKKVLITVIIVILSLIILAAGAAAVYLGSLYSKISGEDIPIVEREEEYVVPSEPADGIVEITDDTESSDTDEESDDTEPSDGGTDALDSQVAEFEENTPEDEVTSAPIYKREPLSSDIVNVLLLGRDARDNQVAQGVRGRSDSMIIASFNKSTGEVTLTSIMRDSLVPIQGYGWNRINAAYSYGGVGLAINTVNDVFDLDIQNYMVIDFSGLRTLVDSLGGVTVYLNAAEVENYRSIGQIGDGLTVGYNTLNGKQALMHARNRQIGDDFERTRRQRDILSAIFNQVKGMDSLSDALGFVNSATSLITTNLSVGEITSLATSLFNGDVTINTARIPCDGSYKNVRYYGALVLKIDIQKNADYIHDILSN